MGLSVATALFVIALLMSMAGWIWLAMTAFRHGEKTWGILLLVSLILPIGPFVGLAFLILRWPIAKRPAILVLGALPVFALGLLLFFNAVRQANAPPQTPSATATWEDTASPPADAGPRRGAHHGTDSLRVARQETPPATEPPPPAPPLAGPRPGAPGGPAPSLARPPSPPLDSERDPARPPVQLEVLELGDPAPNQLRRLRVRARNESAKPVRELKIELEYLDRRGVRLGRWTTVHSDATPILDPSATGELALQAFFVPPFTKSVRLGVEGVVFGDGTRWPPTE